VTELVAGKSPQPVQFGKDGDGVGEVGLEGSGLGASCEIRVVIDYFSTNAQFGQEAKLFQP
jgi:hypothetical protein